jgi:hypothetical protein
MRRVSSIRSIFFGELPALLIMAVLVAIVSVLAFAEFTVRYGRALTARSSAAV